MVVYKDWEEFVRNSKRLFLRSPERTRYSFKYRARDTKLVLTVTDSTKTLKFKTDQRLYLTKMGVLTSWMLEFMTASAKDIQEQEVKMEEEAKNEALEG